MTQAASTLSDPASPTLAALLRGFHVSWLNVALIAAINTGIAGVLWIDDPRPFWHPLVTTQIYGFVIAYCVNVASPWDSTHPIRRLAAAAGIGAVIGVALVILVKGYSWEHVVERKGQFALNVVIAFWMGTFVSLFFYVKVAAARSQAALARAEADRHLLSKQAVEAELKMMQAQVEPHFLFNTLASVQFLTETDPPAANRLLGHLIAYLRAALPQLRASSTTVGKEVELAEAYLNILRTRIGDRLRFAVDVPPDVRTLAFPPNLLISLVENAVKHGIEPSADGGVITVRARLAGDRMLVSVEDTGQGLKDSSPAAGGGVGLSNIRDRLAALYGSRGRFAIEPVAPRGTRSTIDIPAQPDG